MSSYLQRGYESRANTHLDFLGGGASISHSSRYRVRCRGLSGQSYNLSAKSCLRYLGQQNFDIRPSGSVLPPVFVILRVIHLDFGLQNFLLKMKCWEPHTTMHLTKRPRIDCKMKCLLLASSWVFDPDIHSVWDQNFSIRLKLWFKQITLIWC